MKKIMIAALLYAVVVEPIFADDWSLQKTVRVTQSQAVGQGLYIWTEGSWFPPGHRCEEKTVIYLFPQASSQDGYDQVFAQVLAAKVNGNQIQFGASGDCDIGNPYFKAQYIRVF